MTKHFTLITGYEDMYECCLALLQFFIILLFGGSKVRFLNRR